MKIVAFANDDPVHTALFDALGRLAQVDVVRWRSLAAGRLGYRLAWPSRIPRATRLVQRQLAAHAAKRFAADAFIFTTPDQLELAENLSPRSARVYWAIDDFTQYGWIREETLQRERALIEACTTVFATSKALAELLQRRHRIDGVGVLPNAVPASVIPSTLPPPRRNQPPVAGVMGRMSSRLRLDWLRHVVDSLPWLSWSFVGGVEDAELLPRDEEHVRWLRAQPRCRFVDFVPYAELARHAAAIDVAVMPYSDRSTNPTGSPTRLFLHLAFGYPLVATAGCEQLAEYADFVTTCDAPEDLAAVLVRLRAQDFDDGRREARWAEASRQTWERRAETLLAALKA